LIAPDQPRRRDVLRHAVLAIRRPGIARKKKVPSDEGPLVMVPCERGQFAEAVRSTSLPTEPFQAETHCAPQRFAQAGRTAFSIASRRRASSAGVGVVSFMPAGLPSLQGPLVLHSMPTWCSLSFRAQISSSSLFRFVVRKPCTFGSRESHFFLLITKAMLPQVTGSE